MNSLQESRSCPIKFVLAINDTLSVISGKWKLPILGSLLFGKKRYSELGRSIPKITPRMLSKELKELEMNGIIRRTVYNTIPVTVEYELTDSGKSIGQVLDKMIEWGLEHRQASMSAQPVSDGLHAG